MSLLDIPGVQDIITPDIIKKVAKKADLKPVIKKPLKITNAPVHYAGQPAGYETDIQKKQRLTPVKEQSKTPGSGINWNQEAADLALMPFGLAGFWATVYRGLTNPGAMTPTQFGATQTAGLFGAPGWYSSVAGILKTQESGVQGVAPPGVNIFPPAITTIIEGGGGGSIFNFPDLSGLKKYAIPLLIGIAGLYIAGKVISR